MRRIFAGHTKYYTLGLGGPVWSCECETIVNSCIHRISLKMMIRIQLHLAKKMIYQTENDFSTSIYHNFLSKILIPSFSICYAKSYLDLWKLFQGYLNTYLMSYNQKMHTSTVILSNQFPLTHKLKESIPMNQSGDGTILDANETCGNAILVV